jgi:hypothetical protein
MAVDQSGAKASSASVSPEADEAEAASSAPSSESAEAKPELDDVKRKFREALDRKRGVHAAANAEGAQDTGKVHGAHGPAANRRSFRRKSG